VGTQKWVTTVSKEFKFSKTFGTHSTFNALFLKSLIFLIESMLMCSFLKIQKKKYKKNQNLQKKKVEGPILKA